ncbi:MAG: iron-containing alcohol dehydrogenase [Clostridiales bacterium]|jgi:alcohol dehydrogenase class IV|nr:iron-containing alcohol dehydrogenase [Clostridiales bacterium]
MNMNFKMPTTLITGLGCVGRSSANLAALGSACLIVTGASSAKRSGALADMETALKKENIRYELYDKTEQNPTVLTCLEAGEKARAAGADFIVGIGGGSPLDAAKAAAVFAANPGMSERELFSGEWKNSPLPVAAVGTTAGTGSEVTQVSVLTTSDGLKKSIRDDRLFPALSLGDPAYTATMPVSFTLSTAADAMAHCVESYFNRLANDISRTFAVRGVSLLADTFKKILKGGADSLGFDEREALYNASIYGGLAISVTGTAFPHAVGYFLSERHNVPHGTACAVFLPLFIRHNIKCEPEQAKEFFLKTGISGDELISLVEAVTPKCDVSVTEKDLRELAPRWTDNASIKKSFGVFSPEFTTDAIRQLFKKD